jgi:type II secretory pathway pseudopilin PulG
MNQNRRRAFTLIEILVACLVLGIGVTSLIALLLVGLQRARQVTALTTMGPVATAAASLCLAHNQIPAAGSGNFLILPDATNPPTGGIRPLFPFSSPYALRVDNAPGTGQADPTQSGYTPGTPFGDAGVAGADDAQLLTLRVRVYDNAIDRDADIRCLGTMFLRVNARARP